MELLRDGGGGGDVYISFPAMNASKPTQRKLWVRLTIFSPFSMSCPPRVPCLMK